VDSTPGRGSVFTVSVPLSGTGGPEVAQTPISDRIRAQVLTDLGATNGGHEEAVRLGEGQHESRAQAGSSSRRQVLLVEDNEDLRRYLVRLLRGDGWEVTDAPDVETALAIGSMPDLVLSDIMMPGLDGMAFVRMLRANPDLSRTPVILLTACAGRGVRR